MRNGMDIVKMLAILIMIGLTVRNPKAAVSIANDITQYVTSALGWFTRPVTQKVQQSKG